VEFTPHAEVQLFALLISVGFVLVFAAWTKLPAAIPLVLGGLLLGFVPGLPHVQLPPDLVLVAILPPLLYSSAFFTGLRDLRANLRPISLLAVGLTVATTGGIAWVAHEHVGLGWASAFTLGAIVSPTDALAATEIARRVGAPRRVVSIIEGESLVNDGIALVIYKTAVTAAVAGTFSLWGASWRLIVNVIGGIAIGLAVGYVVRQIRRRVDDPPTEVAIALLSGYLAYLPAAAIGVSGVLAAVTIGVYMGWYTPQLTNVETRLSGNSFWEILTFLVFALVGLQLRGITDRLDVTGTLLRDAAIVAVTVVVIRLVFVPIFTYVPRLLFRSVRERDPYPPWQAPVIISWAGFRGAVSLAAALALPTDVPGRDLILFLTFAVILVTLVGQGLSLPWLIRLLHLEDDGQAEREDAKARVRAAEAALERLEELAGEDWVRDDTAERMRGQYRFRTNRFRARYHGVDDDGVEERSAAYQRLRRELLDAERRAVVELRNAGTITEAVMQRVQRDIDLEDSRLDA
jgi:CPA1 family monovalent cation:H+ antiporter